MNEVERNYVMRTVPEALRTHACERIENGICFRSWTTLQHDFFTITLSISSRTSTQPSHYCPV
jgi:hypothetical protein